MSAIKPGSGNNGTGNKIPLFRQGQTGRKLSASEGNARKERAYITAWN
jgi:hypothetical protein